MDKIWDILKGLIPAKLGDFWKYILPLITKVIEMALALFKKKQEEKKEDEKPDAN